ncbi:hypothetical protein C8R47DRAFT_117255 [Mycena vitilis]|nr:hypothetical protein C8R47DRAFT_117255 [Mycena vitilis]
MSKIVSRFGATNPALSMASTKAGSKDLKANPARPLPRPRLPTQLEKKTASSGNKPNITLGASKRNDKMASLPSPRPLKASARPNAHIKSPWVVPTRRAPEFQPPSPAAKPVSRLDATRRAADTAPKAIPVPRASGRILQAPRPAGVPRSPPVTSVRRPPLVAPRTTPTITGRAARSPPMTPARKSPVVAPSKTPNLTGHAGPRSTPATAAAPKAQRSRIPVPVWRYGRIGGTARNAVHLSDTLACSHCGAVPALKAPVKPEDAPKPTAAAPRVSIGIHTDSPPPATPSAVGLLVPAPPIRASFGTQTDPDTAPAPIPAPAIADAAPTPDAAHRAAMAAMGAMIISGPRLKGSAAFRRARATQGAGTNEDLLGELKRRFSSPGRTPLKQRAPEETLLTPSPSPAPLRPRRVQQDKEKENEGENLASELTLAFARLGRGRDVPVIASDSAVDGPATPGFIRPPLAPVPARNNVVSSSPADFPVPLKARRRMLPELDNNAKASRDPRTLLELQALRLQGRVAGGGSEGKPERAMSLVAQGILIQRRKEQKNLFNRSVSGSLCPATSVISI